MRYGLCLLFLLLTPIILSLADGPCEPAPAGLVSWWRAEGNANDWQGTNHGTVSGLGFAPGKVGQAFFFTSAAQDVAIPASASVNVGAGAGLTIETWIEPSDALTRYPIAEWNDGVNLGAHFWLNVSYAGLGGPGCLYAAVQSGDLTAIIATPPGKLTAEAWQHVAFTYDRNSGYEHLYLNGEEVASRNIGNRTAQTTYPLHLGHRPGAEGYRGLMDELSLYNRALSAGEIRSIYSAGTGGKCLFQFTNVVSDYVSLNVRGRLESAAYNRSYIISSNFGPGDFSIQAAAILARYDDFKAPPQYAVVPVSVGVRLRDVNAGADVPITQPIVIQNVNLASHDGAIPPAPVTAVLNLEIPLAPVTAGTDYQAFVTLTHIDGALGEIVDDEIALKATRFTRLSGKLFFGAIETRFTQLSQEPVQPDGTIRLAVANQSGFVAGKPDHTYGDGTPLDVTLDAQTGDAHLKSGVVVLSGPMSDIDEINRVRFIRTNITLNASGARSERLTAFFPAGFGVATNATDRMLLSATGRLNVTLDQALAPVKDVVFSTAQNGGNPLFAAHERVPCRFQIDSLRWLVSKGEFSFKPLATQFFRENELAALESDIANGLVDNASQADRPGNDHYFRSMDNPASEMVVRATADGKADFDGVFYMRAGQYAAHFPDQPGIEFEKGELVVSQGAIDTANSRLAGVKQVLLRYARNCQETNCLGAADAGQLAFTPGGGDASLNFTSDGGFVGKGTLLPARLEWGAISKTEFAHEAGAFSDAALHLAGYALAGSTPASQNGQRSAVLLLTGFALPDVPGLVERPDSDGYSAGFANYAGLNLRVAKDGAIEGRSILAAQPTAAYPMAGFSKYYARPSGISGIHQAAAFPGQLILYGFVTHLDGLRLSFLDSQNVESRTGGSVVVPEPSGFSQEFERLRFGCRGQLADARVPSPASKKTLTYWVTDFVPHALEFRTATNAPCDKPDQGILVIGLETRLPLVADTLHGTLGFKPDGNISSKSDPYGVDSRLNLPPLIRLAGPGGTQYEFHPVTGAYFNSYLKGSPAIGFVNFAGKLSVPFFHALKIHAHAEPSTGALFMMGGWPGDPNRANNSDLAWVDAANRSYFERTDFDENNRGFPEIPGWEAYRNSATEKYHPRAQKTWLGVASFDYAATWDPASRRFGPQGEQPIDLALFNVPGRLKQLTPKNVEMAFGVDLKDLLKDFQALANAPKFTVAQLLVDKLDEQTDVLRALNDSINETLGKAEAASGITRAIETMDSLVSDRLNRILGPPLDAAFAPVSKLVYQQLVLLAGTNGKVSDAIAALCSDKGNSTLAGDFLTGPLKKLTSPGNDAASLLNQLDQALGDVESNVDDMILMLSRDPDDAKRYRLFCTLLKKLAELKLYRDDASYAAFRKIGCELADPLMSYLFERTGVNLDEYFNDVLAQQVELKQQLQDARADLREASSQLSLAISKITSLPGDLDGLAAAIRKQVRAYLESLHIPDEQFLRDVSEADVTRSIQQAIENRILGSVLPEKLAFVLRARFGPAQGLFQRSFDQLLAGINAGVQEAIIEEIRKLQPDEITALENKIESVMSEARGIGKCIQAAALQGYARNNGDSLDELRLEGRLKLSLQDDVLALETRGWMSIRSYNSDSPAEGCLEAGAVGAEVTVGIEQSMAKANGVLAAGFGGKITATLDGKVSLGKNGLPVALTARESLLGDIDIGDFKFKQLDFRYAFGASANYATAKAEGTIKGIDAIVPLFIGRVCSIEPLQSVDPQFARILDLSTVKEKLSLPVSPINPITGFLVGAKGTYPFEKLFNLPTTCVISLVGATEWNYFGFFAEKSKIVILGARQSAAITGKMLCLLTVNGGYELVGAGVVLVSANVEDWKKAGVWVYGKGEVGGEVGVCPACLEKNIVISVSGFVSPGGTSYEVKF